MLFGSYAFLEPKKEANDEWRLNLTRVLEYLYPISPETMLDFVIWSKGQEVYMNKSSFDATVIRFFTKLKEKEGKWPKELTKQKLEQQLKTKMLYAKLNKAMQPAFIKMMSKYGKAIAVSVISIVVCAGIGVGGYWAYNYYLGAPTNESGAEAKPTPNEGIILNPPVASLNLTKPGINTVVLNLEDEIVLSLDRKSVV